MIQETTQDKINKNKNIIDNNLKITLKKIAHPFMLALAQTKIKYKLKKENKYVTNKDKPIIFAVNHTNSQDIPIACTAIGKHGYLLIGKQNLETLDELFFKLNGAIFVDRNDKKDKAASKEAMIKYLEKNVPIIMFPEATWNMTDEKLMLPMRWGIIDIAKEANAQIVPVVLDYDKKENKCKVRFGRTINVEEKNKKDLINELRDEMATIRYEFFEEKGKTRREEIDKIKERHEIERAIYEYPKLDYEYEKTTIYKPYIEQDEVFEPLKRLRR